MCRFTFVCEILAVEELAVAINSKVDVCSMIDRLRQLKILDCLTRCSLDSTCFS